MPAIFNSAIFLNPVFDIIVLRADNQIPHVFYYYPRLLETPKFAFITRDQNTPVIAYPCAVYCSINLTGIAMKYIALATSVLHIFQLFVLHHKINAEFWAVFY